MADLINLTLATKGLDLVSSPLGLDPGALLEAQNVEWVRVQGLGGLGSRGALAPLNSIALAGTILTIAPIPLPSPADDPIPSIILLRSDGYYRSSDGVTLTFFSLGTFAPSGVGIAVTSNGDVGIVGPYDDTSKTTTVKINNTDVSVPGNVAGIAAHPNGRFYVSVVNNSFGFTGIQNNGGWNGTQWDNPGKVATHRTTGYVAEISAGGVILRQIGESFGLDETGSALGPTAKPNTTFGLEDGRPSLFNRGPIGGAPGGIACSASGRIYVTYGTYFLNGVSGSSVIDLYNGIDLLSIDPDNETTWSNRVNGSALGVSRTEFDVTGAITSGPGPVLPDAFSADKPWWAGFSPDPFTVSSSLGVTSGDKAGSCVFSKGLSSNLLIFGDPDGGSIPGIAYWQSLIMFGGKIFVSYWAANSPTSDPNTVKIYVASSDDSTTLTLDLNVLTSVAPVPPSTHVLPGTPYIFDDGGGDKLYWPFYGLPGHTSAGFILKRTSGGVWSVHASGLSNLTGPAIFFTQAP